MRASAHSLWMPSIISLLICALSVETRAQCPPVNVNAFDVLTQREAVDDYLRQNLDLSVGFPMGVVDDFGVEVLGAIRVVAFSQPNVMTMNPKVFAKFAALDAGLGGNEDDHLSILASRMGGHHFGWLQIVDGGNNSIGAVRPDGTQIFPTYVDPQSGGFGDHPASPGFNDAIAADRAPWHYNHAECDTSMFSGAQPEAAIPGRNEFTTEDAFWFEDGPNLPEEGDLSFSTWLMLLNADNSANRTLPGFRWTYERGAVVEVINVTGPLDPISDNTFHTFTQGQLFLDSAPPPDAPVNGDFIQEDDNGPVGWNTTGSGDSQVVQDSNAADSFAVELTAGSPVTISQSIGTPSEPFRLLLSLVFESTASQLVVELEDQIVATIDGVESVNGAYQTFLAPVTDPTLLGRDSVSLEITFDGVTNSWVRLDTVAYVEIPEPSSLAICCGLLVTIRRRRCAANAT